jgi:hypothetical protein
MLTQAIVSRTGKVEILVTLQSDAEYALSNLLPVNQSQSLQLEWVLRFQAERDLNLPVLHHFTNDHFPQHPQSQIGMAVSHAHNLDVALHD